MRKIVLLPLLLISLLLIGCDYLIEDDLGSTRQSDSTYNNDNSNNESTDDSDINNEDTNTNDPDDNSDEDTNSNNDNETEDTPININDNAVNLGDFNLNITSNSLRYTVEIINNTGADLSRLQNVSLKLYYQGQLIADGRFPNINQQIANSNTHTHTFIFGTNDYDPNFSPPSGSYQINYEFNYDPIYVNSNYNN